MGIPAHDLVDRGNSYPLDENEKSTQDRYGNFKGVSVGSPLV